MATQPEPHDGSRPGEAETPNGYHPKDESPRRTQGEADRDLAVGGYGMRQYAIKSDGCEQHSQDGKSAKDFHLEPLLGDGPGQHVIHGADRRRGVGIHGVNCRADGACQGRWIDRRSYYERALA